MNRNSTPGSRRNFARAILFNEPLLAPGEDGMNAVELIDGMILSSKTGKTVSVPVNRAEYDALIEELKVSSRAKNDREGNSASPTQNSRRIFIRETTRRDTKKNSISNSRLLSKYVFALICWNLRRASCVLMVSVFLSGTGNQTRRRLHDEQDGREKRNERNLQGGAMK